jgi:hypothetical protein
MTVRDPEVLELLRDEPELLALADAVNETQRPPRRRLLARRAPRFALVGTAAVAAAALVFLLLPDRVSHPGVVDRALAAIGDGRVLHLRYRMPTGVVLVDLKTGRRTVQMFETEIWYDRDTRRLHFLERAQGRVADIVLPDDLKKGDMYRPKTLDPAFAALTTGYRTALANGDAKLERSGTVDGHSVYWLRFRTTQAGTAGTEVAIDRRTYKPVLIREDLGHGRHMDQHVLVAETTAYRASDFKRLGPNVFALELAGGGSSTMNIPPSRPVVRSPWLTAGPRVAGLRLTAVNPSTEKTRGHTFRGVQLIYGPVNRGPYQLTIEEMGRPADLYTWRDIPRGAVAVQAGGEASSGRGQQEEWTGYVVKHGVYVTIQTLRGERAVLAVARALRPAR